MDALHSELWSMVDVYQNKSDKVLVFLRTEKALVFGVRENLQITCTYAKSFAVPQICLHIAKAKNGLLNKIKTSIPFYSLTD